MTSLVGVLFGLAFGGAGLLVFYKASTEFRTVYHILTNDPVPVRDLPTRSGPVEIEGTARPAEDHDPVTSMFTRTDCLVYEYEVEEYRSHGKHSSWKTLDQGKRGVPFQLADDTGAVRVEPAGADLHLANHRIRVDGGDEPPEHIAEYIAATDDVDSQDKSIDVVVTELNYGNDQRFTERRLDLDESVYVYGSVGRGDGGGGWGSDLVDAVVTDGDALPAFVVSDTHERGTAWRIGKRAVVLLVFGLVFAGVGGFLILQMA